MSWFLTATGFSFFIAFIAGPKTRFFVLTVLAAWSLYFAWTMFSAYNIPYMGIIFPVIVITGVVGGILLQRWEP